MKLHSKMTTLIILSWMALIVFVFILVTVPAQSSLNSILPEIYWQLRDLIYPLFSDRSAL